MSERKTKGVWALAVAVTLSAAACLSFIWALPYRDEANGAGEAPDDAFPGDGSMQEGSGTSTGQGQPSSGEERGPAEGGQDGAPPASDSQPPSVVLNLPDPVVPKPEKPPPQGYEDVLGHWVADMWGTSYGLSNCHLYLEEGGGVTTPAEYDPVFEILQGSYHWEKGSPAFDAALTVLVKAGSDQNQVPVKLELEGEVLDSFTEIRGNFTAVPQNEAYAVYAQRGSFIMRR